MNGLYSIAVRAEGTTVRPHVRLPKEQFPSQKQQQQPKSGAEQTLLNLISKRSDFHNLLSYHPVIFSDLIYIREEDKQDAYFFSLIYNN